jgi:hypothetical protein
MNENIQIEAINLEINGSKDKKKKEKKEINWSVGEIGILSSISFIGIVIFGASVNLLWNSVSNSG